MEDYSGRVLVRMPKELHKKLSLNAEYNEVSLNQYIVYLLTLNQANFDQEQQLSNQAESGLEKNPEMIKEVKTMSQDVNTGRRGNEVGRLIGEAVAQRLRINLEPGSNKGRLGNDTVVIKSARLGNPQFGITNTMAEEIDRVIVAKETTEGVFDLYSVRFDKIEDTGKPTRSKGASSGKVTNFRVSEVVSKGERFDTIEVKLPYPPNRSV